MGGTGTRTLQVAAKPRLFMVGVSTGEWSGSSGLLTWNCSYSIAPSWPRPDIHLPGHREPLRDEVESGLTYTGLAGNRKNRGYRMIAMPSVAPPAAAANGNHDVALSVRDLVKTFLVGGGVFGGEKGEVSAVAGVSFEIGAGRTLGLVGESGCGKSTTARSILRLIEPTSGEVVLTRPLDGGGSERIDVIAADRRQLRELRRHMQIVFQDPFASLNPRMSVGTAIGELLHVHTGLTRKERSDRVGELLSLVGMNPNVADRYPHEFSGGQRQRIGVARALALNPGFLILDEPVSALDVSIQAQVLNLLEELQDRLGLTYLFIAHDLAVGASHLR